MKKVIRKFKLIDTYPALVYTYFNVYLIIKVCFRYRIVTIREAQEKRLKKIYKATIL